MYYLAILILLSFVSHHNGFQNFMLCVTHTYTHYILCHNYTIFYFDLISTKLMRNLEIINIIDVICICTIIFRPENTYNSRTSFRWCAENCVSDYAQIAISSVRITCRFCKSRDLCLVSGESSVRLWQTIMLLRLTTPLAVNRMKNIVRVISGIYQLLNFRRIFGRVCPHDAIYVCAAR